MVDHRLLLIEDDFDVAEMLVMYFQSIDYEVLHGDHGAAGIELARTKFPHLILLDVMLPDMDGYEICYRLRQMSLTKHIPVLFLTQKDERASKVKGLELGADDYITKPFDIEELRLRVEGAIRRATRENIHEPRTGLPSGPMVAEERAKRSGKFNELTFKLHGFDIYSDVYSFMAANDVLNHAGKVIRDVLSEDGYNDAFVGVSNNDFVVFVELDDPKPLEAKISQRFRQQVRAFYSFADADRGGILLNAGEDDETVAPIMSLTTGEPLSASQPSDAKSSDSLLEW